jgi:hypothetical protein
VTDFRIRYLPGVSHWVQQEQPEAVNAMIAAFVQGKEIPEYSEQGELLPAEGAVP